MVTLTIQCSPSAMSECQAKLLWAQSRRDALPLRPHPHQLQAHPVTAVGLRLVVGGMTVQLAGVNAAPRSVIAAGLHLVAVGMTVQLVFTSAVAMRWPTALKSRFE